MIDIVLNVSILPLLFLDIILVSWLVLFLKTFFSGNKKVPEIKKFPRVSVIIPARNEEKNIERTLLSVKSQSYPNLEVIVIDDASTDKTYEIAKKFAKTYRFKERKGKPYSLNFGIKKATGKYILTLDADTIFKDKDAIKKLVSILESDKDIAAVTTSLKVLNKNNILTYFQSIEYNYQNLIRFGMNSLKLGTLYIWGCSTLFRKNVLEKIKFRESYTEDLDTIIRIQMKKYKVLISPEVVAYTVVPEKIIHFIKQRIRWNQLIFECIKDYRKVFFNPLYSSLGLYSLPLTIFWFPFSLIMFPLVLYQIIYWLQFQKTIVDVFVYIFFWFSLFGNVNYIFKVLMGVWKIHISSFLGVLAGILTFFLVVLSLLYYREKDPRDYFFSLFLFPYFLFQNFIIMISFFYFLLRRKF